MLMPDRKDGRTISPTPDRRFSVLQSYGSEEGACKISGRRRADLPTPDRQDPGGIAMPDRRGPGEPHTPGRGEADGLPGENEWEKVPEKNEI